MRLAELEPQWLKCENSTEDRGSKMVDRLEDADGILFICPECKRRLGTDIGAHSIICWRPRVPQTISPTPGRWEFSGKDFNDLTLTAGSSSILLTSVCKAHFYVRSGVIEFC